MEPMEWLYTTLQHMSNASEDTYAGDQCDDVWVDTVFVPTLQGRTSERLAKGTLTWLLQFDGRSGRVTDQSDTRPPKHTHRLVHDDPLSALPLSRMIPPFMWKNRKRRRLLWKRIQISDSPSSNLGPKTGGLGGFIRVRLSGRVKSQIAVPFSVQSEFPFGAFPVNVLVWARNASQTHCVVIGLADGFANQIKHIDFAIGVLRDRKFKTVVAIVRIYSASYYTTFTRSNGLQIRTYKVASNRDKSRSRIRTFLFYYYYIPK
ncbi:hypothetical protein NEUTE1DRAFT_114466 [Neurospora tetrasperma FGSC 2508]|uniref:Uncharacterized protein n=1 Tax=Neurospora tetrasperma (strain FGSC 2508 / ATCC MYA-4615 / P0657) TaxID=510951 RepID=F8N2P3_NEUT8|nr:uncharacterized protein NEUTE1DRAFT_114466 [Neurospora tetrasperma FGSC 2508]EGO52511.1 hypothetical protein NEUTE1DRAFT_114466 [Neurospora tetrasperma FGSC 2508]